MTMAWIYGGAVCLALAYGVLSGQIQAVSAAAIDGAGQGVQLALTLCGTLCLWNGVMEILRRAGTVDALARGVRPLLRGLFPLASRDEEAAGAIAANLAASALGLGNAATPPGLKAARRLHVLSGGGASASDELCRFLVLNTASIQLIPTSVAALRASAGSHNPMDILPAVLLTSLCSVTAGLFAATVFGKVWKS